jgi:hypothetical protein
MQPTHQDVVGDGELAGLMQAVHELAENTHRMPEGDENRASAVV